ncbi:hypothetical protein J1N35_035707 [Gossypium stocksii]|uniref:Uncharacterized protein n=1 Tax=Gossypium stocksii TaxID=47602 RepID=A0A9D3UUG2_9ROSI|nr:hypothetical protein J1N35_035707 [Gossypium stocksii]
MVCQAASQTRFRALKYENGIAGSATIVVRVIACFQPLQDCQVCFFLCTKQSLYERIRYPFLFECLFLFLIYEIPCSFSSIFVNDNLFESFCLWGVLFLQAEYFRHLLKPVT